MSAKGKVSGVNGNMITVDVSDKIAMNEVGYVLSGGKRLKSEVIRINGTTAQMQIYEISGGIKVGDDVEFSGEMLAAELGPGLLGQIYDGLQNPLPELAEKTGFFLAPGVYLDALDRSKKWAFTPAVQTGETVEAGDTLGTVPEGAFTHRIMVPFSMRGRYTVESIAGEGEYTVTDKIARIKDSKGNGFDLTMMFEWPVKRAIKCYSERLKPVNPMISQVRLIDTFLPVALGGTFCIPGPFGAGKTVLQQTLSRHAAVDIVIIAACGERAGEVVETLKEFPELTDPKTGRSLMERTIIIANTSSMPVASREASVYTAVTLAEYYRQMGLNVLLMREMSGRLEEIPGEEAFPAYLESTIAAFYERAGLVKLKDGSIGSVTIGGTVSPAGGNFDEPVTQATLKVVGAFLGLSRERSDARKYPAIHPLESWSKYKSLIPSEVTGYVYDVMRKSAEIDQMMKVVGEEGTSLDDFLVYLKGEYVDAVYFQQNSFDPVDAAVPTERQHRYFKLIVKIAAADLKFESKDEARRWFAELRLKTLDFNGTQYLSEDFLRIEKEIEAFVDERKTGYLPYSEGVLKTAEEI